MRAQLISVLLLAGCGGTAVVPPPAPPPTPKQVVPPPDPVVMPPGYVVLRPTDVVAEAGGAALMLLDETTNKSLPVLIGGTEGHSIELRLRGGTPIRPLTHDLLDDAVKKLKGAIVKVHIDALRDGIFHGSVYIRSGRRVLRLDARPSDAIALAIGNGVPIYCAKAVIDEAGVTQDALQADAP